MNPLQKGQLRCKRCGSALVRDTQGSVVHADGVECKQRSCSSCGAPLFLDPVGGQLEHSKPVCFNVYAFGIPGGDL